jgi:polyisoprenoid-binding protein YceI
MTYRSTARTVFGLIFAIAFTAVATIAARSPQDPAAGGLALTSGKVTIAGTSNVHDFTAATTVVKVTRAEFTPRATGWDAALKPGTLTAFDIAIPVTTLKSDKDGLDKNMYKALKAEQFANITFKLVKLDAAAQADCWHATGVLNIAGVDRQITLDLQTERKGNALTVQGQARILMTDFGIAPPKAMLGMLKTDPRVTVSFMTVLALPLS